MSTKNHCNPALNFQADLARNGIDTVVIKLNLQVLKVLDLNVFDLVIVDIYELVEGNLEVVQWLRIRYHKPILLKAHRPNEQDELLAYESGIDDYLHDSFGTEVLMAQVKSWLRRSRIQQNYNRGESE